MASASVMPPQTLSAVRIGSVVGIVASVAGKKSRIVVNLTSAMSWPVAQEA